MSRLSSSSSNSNNANHVHVSWSGLVSNFKTLLTRSPALSAGLAVVATGALVWSVRASAAARSAALEKRRILRSIKRHFSEHRLDVLKYVFEASWNHFDLNQVEAIYTAFKKLLPEDQNRGVLPITAISQLYRNAGLKDERVALACARFWDVDGNAYIDFLELMERLNLAKFGSKVAQLRAFFQVFDLDGSKQISKEEMEEVLTAMSSKSDKLSQHEAVRDIFRRTDLNNDGKLSLQEFLGLAEIEHVNFQFNHTIIQAFGIRTA